VSSLAAAKEADAGAAEEAEEADAAAAACAEAAVFAVGTVAVDVGWKEADREYRSAWDRLAVVYLTE
jgi:hypothetical protein